MKNLKIFCFAVIVLLFNACESDPNKYAVIETDFGNIELKLYATTPGHQANFLKLVDEGFYDDLLFHRVISNFMIQGGDPDSRTAAKEARLGNGGPGYTIPAEIGAPHFRGALAAARLGDGQNPQRESSGSQFFVVTGMTWDCLLYTSPSPRD